MSNDEFMKRFSESYRDAVDDTLESCNGQARMIIKKHFRELYVEIWEDANEGK
jgi:hypothetical protein